MTTITCISQRAKTNDVIYGTGEWLPGQNKIVPDDLARKMLKHKDTYVMAEMDEGAQPVTLAEKPIEDKSQDTYDRINRMSKGALKQFCKENFKQDIDLRKSDRTLREEAARSFAMYGLS